MINQKLFESLLDVSKIFIGIYDVDTDSFIKINKSGFQLFKTDSIDQINESIKKHIGIEGRLHQMLATLKVEKYWETELFFTQDGCQFWGKTEINLLEDDTTTYLLVRITNIDSYKRAQLAIQTSEERFKAVFENAAVGIIVTEKSGEIVMANHFMENLFGYSSGELIGQKVELLLPDSLRTVHIRHREDYTKQHKIRPMGEGLELQGQRKNGSQFPVEVSLSYFFDKEQMFVVAFIQDISFKVQAAQQLHDQKKAIEQLNASLETQVISRTQALLETLQHLEKSKKELEKALVKEKELGELKSRFVAMASHEFRTPLSAILSSATLIGKYTSPEEQPKREKHIARIQSSVGYLTDILEEFLSVDKLEEGQIKAKFDFLDWNHLMNEIIVEVKSLLKRGQKIIFTHKGEAMIFLDKSLLRKILINIISNAIKFSPEDANIEISSQMRHEYFTVSIRDHGIGISETDLKHLFERFFRGTNAVNIQGTGLGLHIVARYVELMYGKIDIQSMLNEGTVVQLMFYAHPHAALGQHSLIHHLKDF